MALEVEDGTGKANAVSYISLADADTYFAARAVEAWEDADEVEKESALIRATDALDSWARGRWKGTKKTSTQALAWPREDVVDEEGFDVPTTVVPTPVSRATS